MTHWLEIRAWQERVGVPFFVSLDDYKTGLRYIGFRSVYAYPDHVKQAITEQRSTAGLDWAPVYADQLLVDFDNNDAAAGEFVAYLYDEGYACEVYNSGNRSTHVHVWCEPADGTWVPWSQRCWVAKHAPGADLTFYHQAGQFRLPGTRHAKTGRRKELQHELSGKLLAIDRVDKPLATASAPKPGAFFAHLLRHKGEGERRVYVWHLAKQARAEGYEFAEALAHILWWNARYCVPALAQDAVRQKVLEVYRQ